MILLLTLVFLLVWMMLPLLRLQRHYPLERQGLAEPCATSASMPVPRTLHRPRTLCMGG